MGAYDPSLDPNFVGPLPGRGGPALDEGAGVTHDVGHDVYIETGGGVQTHTAVPATGGGKGLPPGGGGPNAGNLGAEPTGGSALSSLPKWVFYAGAGFLSVIVLAVVATSGGGAR